MALTAGALSQVSVTAVGDVLASAVAVSGTTPYSYQWYRSTVTGFTPGTGNSISGATTLSLTDTSLTPGTVYYYKVQVTDSNGTPVIATSAQLQVTTLSQSPSQNQFQPLAILGQVDMFQSPATIPVQFDPAGSGTLVAGQAVKWSTVATGNSVLGTQGAILVVPSTSASDVVAGFVNYNIKDVSYAAGSRLEMSMGGNIMYLYATNAISRGQQVVSVPAGVAGGCNGGVAYNSGGGQPIVGYALDTAVSGQLVRVLLKVPSGLTA